MNSNLQNLKKLFEENQAAAEKAETILDGKPEEMKDALIALAKEYGIALEDSDFQKEDEELNIEDLDAVAGGSAEIALAVAETVFGMLPESSYSKRTVGRGGTNRR